MQIENSAGDAIPNRVMAFALDWIGLSFVQWALIAGVLLAYFTLLQTRSGQTLGMRALGVTVVDADGSTISTQQALVRNGVLLAPIPFMALTSIFVPFVGFPLAFGMMVVWRFVELAAMFFLGTGQRLGDKAAGTFVVEKQTLATGEFAETPGEVGRQPDV